MSSCICILEAKFENRAIIRHPNLHYVSPLVDRELPTRQIPTTRFIKRQDPTLILLIHLLNTEKNDNIFDNFMRTELYH